MNQHPGLMASFVDEETLLRAAHAAHQHGYQRVEAFSPYPVDGLAEAIGFHQIAIPLAVFVAGAAGAASGYLLQYWCMAVDYPINVGGRPYHSWPSFLPVTFEMTVLFAAITAFTLFVILNGLPRLYHRLFAVPEFHPEEHGFYLLLEAGGTDFDPAGARAFLESLTPLAVYEVPDA